MRNNNNIFKEFDAILSWVQWGDNREYYKMWKDDPRITSKNRAKKVLGYDVAKSIFEKDANLLCRTLYDLIHETFYSAYRGIGDPLSVSVLDDITALPKVEALAEFLAPYGAKKMKDWLNSGATHKTRSGKLIDLKEEWGDEKLFNPEDNNEVKKYTIKHLDDDRQNSRLKTYKNYVYYIFNDILLGRFTPLFITMQGNEKRNPKNLATVNRAIDLFCKISTRLADAWESWVHRNISRLQNKLRDDQYKNYMQMHNIEIVNPKKEGPVKSIAETYTEWFKSMGSEFRIMPEEMKMDGGSVLIDKFNFVFMVMAYEWMRLANSRYQSEIDKVKQWIDSHPLSGSFGSTADPYNLPSYYDKSFDEVQYPSTVGTDKDFYNTKKNFSFMQRSEYTDKTTGEKRVNEKIKEIKIGQIISFVDSKTKDPGVKKVCAAMNKTFLKHNLENLPDDMKTCVVISCHEYDIIGQSTNRPNWHSCQDIYTGSYKDFVETGMLAGAIIAYYCDRSDTNVHTSGHFKWTKDYKGRSRQVKVGKDKWTDLPNGKVNISNPLGRILIKPFVKRGEKQDYNDPNWILLCSKKYGEFPDDLIDKVQQWLDKNWNKDIIEKLGEKQEYDIAKGVYRDTPTERNGVTY